MKALAETNLNVPQPTPVSHFRHPEATTRPYQAEETT